MQEINNLNLFIVGIAVAAIAILGFVVFYNKRSSSTNRAFLLFSIMAVAWNGVNYLAYEFNTQILILWFLRLGLFFAVWYCFTLFRFLYIFPAEQSQLQSKNWYRYGMVPLAIIASIITLTPLAITAIHRTSAYEQGSSDVLGFGMAIFGLTVITLIISGLITFLRKIFRAPVEERHSYRLVIIGAAITFTLYVIFNFIFPTFLANSQFVPYGSIFTFPLIACTGYAIIRLKLFSVKVVSTEFLVFFLALATLFEVVISNSVALVVFRSSVFLLVLSIGVLLIRSVINEVKQREELERLTEELKIVNEKLEALDKARAEFISIASHQLRTPPATIKWYVAAVLSGDFGAMGAELKAALERVQSTNNSQISLIDDLLNASRIERGKMEFFFEKGDLAELARLTYEQLIPQATMRKLKLVYNPPKAPLPQIMMDKEKVRQVINNLVDNAIKYTKQGQITINLEQTATDLVVKVTDTGRGVAPDVVPTLFGKYVRGKDAATAATGLGLGLYVAKVIIDQNHGKMWVESKGEGQGSSFIFSLPIVSDLEETSVVDLADVASVHK